MVWRCRKQPVPDARRPPRVAVLRRPGKTAGPRDAAEQLAALTGIDILPIEAGGLTGDDGEDLAGLLRKSADVVVAWPGPACDLATIQAAHAAVASGVPLVASAQPHLAEIGHAAHRPPVLAEGVMRVLGDQELRASLWSAARGYCAARTWKGASERHKALWRSFGCG